MDIRDILARNIRRRRNALGLSQDELAERAACTRNYIGDIERSENAASVDIIASIAEALGTAPHVLLDPDDDA